MIIKNVKDAQSILSTDEIVAKGTGEVYRQPLIDPEMTEDGVGVLMVSFSPGARLNFHTHSGAQILYIIDGEGILATESEQYTVTPGTVIYIPPGEVHWHGATAKSSFSHLAIQKPGIELAQ